MTARPSIVLIGSMVLAGLGCTVPLEAQRGAGNAPTSPAETEPQSAPRPTNRERESARTTDHPRTTWVYLPSITRPPRPLAFDDAKRALERAVYDADHRTDIYCGCRFDAHKHIQFDDCESAHPYVPEPEARDRAGRMEWDHAMPASFIGHEFPCWDEPTARGESHRDHCRAGSAAFAHAEGDMHNLLPSVGQLNAIRDNFVYAEIPGEDHLANCDFERVGRTVEPRPEARGPLARAMLYAAAVYHVPLAPTAFEVLRAWHHDHPPEAWERDRNDRIARLQGNRNPLIDRPNDAALTSAAPRPSVTP